MRDSDAPRRFQAEERPEGADVAAIVTGAVDWGFREESAAGRTKERMIQEARKGFLADVAAADVLMAVNACAQRGLGIVAVDDRHIVQTEGGVSLGECAVEAFGRANLKARGEEMSGIEANPGRGSDAAGAASVEHVAEMGEFGSEASSLPCCVFE